MNPVSGRVAVILVVLGLALAVAPAYVSSIAICGISRSGGLAIVALALAVVTTFITGVVIGSDLRGCPRSIDRAACLEES